MMIRAIRAAASLRFAIALMVLAMVLIYVATWAQIDVDAYTAQQRYFWSWFTFINIGTILPRRIDGTIAVPGALWFPGGYLIGALMLVSLLANWFTRYKWTWKKAGIHMIHASLVILLLGEAWGSWAKQEGELVLSEGQTKHHVADSHAIELAVIDRSPDDHDLVYSIPQAKLSAGNVISDAKLPVTIRVDELAINSTLTGPMQAPEGLRAQADAGAGKDVVLVPLAPAGGTQSGRSMPSAYVTVLEGEREVGKYLVSTLPPLDEPQKVTLGDGREYWLQLRGKRSVKPYEVTLLDFKIVNYAGTNRPKSFESRVRLVDRERGVEREEVIWMNHPMRYRGETFYQVGAPADDTTVLLVVDNPAIALPYVASALGGVGLLWQFGAGLMAFGRRRRTNTEKATAPAVGGWVGVVMPLLLAGLCVVYMVGKSAVAKVDEGDVAQLPVFHDGRLQPFDSVARNSLRMLSGKSTTQDAEGKPARAMEWFEKVMCRPVEARKWPVFRIENTDLVSMLGLDVARKHFAYAELEPKFDLIEEQFRDAMARPVNQRDLVTRKLVELGVNLQTYFALERWIEMHLMPPEELGGEWRPLGAELQALEASGAEPSPIVRAISDTLLSGIEKGRMQGEASERWLGLMAQRSPSDSAKMRLEVFYNRYQPFMLAMAMYVIVFLLASAAVLAGGSVTLWRSAIAVAAITLVLHSLAIALRVYLQGRPPVTNLYSSAIFIGWGAVLLAVFAELFHRRGIVLLAASLVGTATLVIAQNLAQGGDTMPSMQAVLDSNFWLTTHVLAITYGYSAAFLAGAIGIAFVIAGLVAPKWFDQGRRAGMARMIYATACFAMLFSFVGTLLGGIWADQSWGRFWGWDPKENGAALIVLWLAVMLHVPFVGVGQRGLALLAIGANIVTAWSWFGTNMLGVGLHSYGFMDSALMWLLLFVGSQLALIVAGFCFREPAPASVRTVSRHEVTHTST